MNVLTEFNRFFSPVDDIPVADPIELLPAVVLIEIPLSDLQILSHVTKQTLDILAILNL